MKRHSNQRHPLLDEDQLLGALRNLPARVPPPGLTTSLRVLASREAQRTRRSGWRDVLSTWSVRIRLCIDNLMRPLAVPFAGGVLSALALFGIWLVPTYPQPVVPNFEDSITLISTSDATPALTAKTAPVSMGVSGGDEIVDVFLDDKGYLVGYKVVSGTGVMTDAALRHQLENMLLFTNFFPKAFGKPTAGRMRLSVVSSSIVVKG